MWYFEDMTTCDVYRFNSLPKLIEFMEKFCKYNQDNDDYLPVNGLDYRYWAEDEIPLNPDIDDVMPVFPDLLR